jgi:hypothetical protein
MVEYGLEAIEVYHPCHNHEDLKLAREYAQKFNLFITGGSDFHGNYCQQPVELGCWALDEETIELFQHKQKKKLSNNLINIA